MKKRFYLIFCCIVTCDLCVAQSGEWTWMKGDTGDCPAGVFGTQGVADSLNTPPGLYEAISWTDHQHNFWLFGGMQNGIHGDLWKYDVATNYWTWMTGNAGVNVAGNYGIQGIPSPSNHPGSRGYGGIGWVDSAGNLWMFGGAGYDALGFDAPLNDVWMYNIATNEWTWMKGSTQANQLANYGTLQVSSPANDPGTRYEFNAAWTDEDNNLWMFGGQSNAPWVNLSDVWKYDHSLNEWNWMLGAQASEGYQLPVYGTQGISSPLNSPGSRSVYCISKDLNGKFWTFGGYYMFSILATNDIWMFDPLSLEWTWMGGSPYLEDPGNYIALCDTNSQLPASRFENRSNWTDACGNLWTFGGVNIAFESLSDLWVHNTSTGKWTWVSGSSSSGVPPVYGTQGVPDPANIPGGRSGTSTWTDNSGNLWLFGGVRFALSQTKNDLWRFVPDTSCPAMPDCSAFQVPAFLASDTTVCEKFCIDFTDQSSNNPFAWEWLFPGGTPSSSTDKNPTQICYQVPGVYDVTLTTTNATGTNTITMVHYVTVNATSPFPTITQIGYTLTSSPASSYQWQFNSANIPGGTNQSYNVLQSGYYTVIVGDSNGCKNSLSQYVLISGIHDPEQEAAISIYPNPSSGIFMVEWLNACPAFCGGQMAGNVSIDVVNTLGQRVFSSSEKNSSPGKTEIDLSKVANGIYFIEIKTQNIFTCPDFVGVKKKIIITH